MFHKTNYVRGFHVEATDGAIGHVDDFLVDQNVECSLLGCGHQQLDWR